MILIRFKAQPFHRSYKTFLLALLIREATKPATSTTRARSHFGWWPLLIEAAADGETGDGST